MSRRATFQISSCLEALRHVKGCFVFPGIRVYSDTALLGSSPECVSEYTKHEAESEHLILGVPRVCKTSRGTCGPSSLELYQGGLTMPLTWFPLLTPTEVQSTCPVYGLVGRDIDGRNVPQTSQSTHGFLLNDLLGKQIILAADHLEFVRALILATPSVLLAELPLDPTLVTENT